MKISWLIKTKRKDYFKMVRQIKTQKELDDYRDKDRLTRSDTHPQKSHPHTPQDTFGHSFEGRDAAGKVEAVIHASEFISPARENNE